MAVPFIDLRRFEPDFLDRWAELCRQITVETRFVGGPEVTRLEGRLAQEAGVAEVVGCANGTDALQLALRAVGVGAGDLVAIPDATFWATFEAVVNCSARPLTVDIDPADLQLDADLLREAIRRHRPKAAILVHLYGWGSGRLEEIRRLCHEEGVTLIEDGAQVFGTRWRGESIFHGATVATVSFYPAKVLGSCGDAGAVYCSTPELATRVRQLGNHGRTEHYSYGSVGWNSRMGGFDAAYLNLTLDYVAERIESRRRMVERYHRELPGLGVDIRRPPEGYDENGYLQVSLWAPAQRQVVEAELRRRGIGFGRVYPGAMSTQPGAEPYLAAQVGGDEARKLSDSVVNLPLFAHMREEEVDEVLAAMAEVGELLND